MSGATSADVPADALAIPSGSAQSEAATRHATRSLAWIWTPIAIAVSSRGLSAAMVLLANHLSRLPHANPLAAWDAGWYLGIARNGYHANALKVSPSGVYHDFAFFPLWPTVLRLVTPSGLTGADAARLAVVVANVLFVAAAVAVWRVIANRIDPRTATVAMVPLAFGPASYVFSLAYSEPLLLLLAALGFLVPRGSLLRLPLAALAVGTRIAGTAVVMASAVMVLARRGRVRWVSLLTAIAGTAAFAAWWLFIARLTHDPMGFLHGSPGWARLTGLPGIIKDLEHATPQRIAWTVVVLIVLVGAVRIARRDLELGIYSMAIVAMVALPGSLIESAPRYVLAAFPAFAGLSLGLGRWRLLALVAAGVVLQWFFVSWAFIRPGAFPP